MGKIPNRLVGGEELSSLRPWLNDLRDYAQSITPCGDKKTICVNSYPNGVVISSLQTKGGGSGGGGGGNAYTGPFAVTVNGIVPAGGEVETEYASVSVKSGYIMLGLYRIVFPETLMAPDVNDWIYLMIYASVPGVALAEAGADLPLDGEDHITIPLAKLTAGVPYQHQYGTVHMPGRIV